MTECHLLEKCGFFTRFAVTRENECGQLINTYCRGSRMKECKRLQYLNQYGVPPSDNMLPDGSMVK